MHLLNPCLQLLICNSILFSRFWIIFTITIWNSLSGRFPISSSFVWFGGHLSCSFICWVFLCLFLLFILLFGVAFLYSGSLWSSLYCGVSSLWVGLYRWLVKVSWLGKPVWCSGGWIWISSLWSAMKSPIMSYEMPMFLE